LKETKKHTKHTNLIKPVGGQYHSNEWAMLGAPCSIINKFAKDLANIVSTKKKVGYMDANKKHFSSLDVLLVNGNHFHGDKQIVFINEKKKESLERKLDRISDLKILIVQSESQEIYNFIKPYITEKTEILHINEVNRVAEIILKDDETNIPKLNGLVLAGGKSQRMGRDKGAINYHGKDQREYEADLLASKCEKVFISISDNQAGQEIFSYKIIKDSFTGLGPYGAILSAFREQPNHAWLTVACDLPLLTPAIIEKLVSSRNPSKVATCFHNPETKFPEPLITIWEPRAYPKLLEFLSQGYSCPRKVLINTDVEQIYVDQVAFMENVNDQKAYEQILAKLNY